MKKFNVKIIEEKVRKFKSFVKLFYYGILKFKFYIEDCKINYVEL